MSEEQLLEIDRMVDGELDRDQQRGLLVRCDERNGWRDLALAYVEAQALRGELKTYVEDASQKPTPTPQPQNENLPWSPWALAAAIMLSLGLGYGLGTLWQRDIGVAPGPLVADTEVPTNDGDATDDLPKPIEAPETMQFMVSNPNTNEWHSIDLPIVKASELGPDWRERLHTPIPDDLVQEMQDRGYRLRQTQTITPVRMQNGQRVLVPMNYYFHQPYQ